MAALWVDGGILEYLQHFSLGHPSVLNLSIGIRGGAAWWPRRSLFWLHPSDHRVERLEVR